MCLASAFLKEKSAKIVLLDEPTSQIDQQTQKKVLQNLFQTYKNQTVLMIAHRLETAVAFADKILVLDAGELVEFDHPLRLLVNNIEEVGQGVTNKESLFGQMVGALSRTQQEKIVRKARKRYNQ